MGCPNILDATGNIFYYRGEKVGWDENYVLSQRWWPAAREERERGSRGVFKTNFCSHQVWQRIVEMVE